MEHLSAGEIASAVNGLLYGDGTISSVTTDSRKILPGSLFIALKGDQFDGNDFLDVAAKAGAAAVLTNISAAMEHCAVIKVQNTHKALMDLAAYYKRKFTLKTVAVTGSVGKTTTKEFIYAVLQSRYCTLKTQGNFNNEIGLPLTVLGLEKKHEAAVLEMGMSAFGEISRMTAVARPDIGVFTNIGISHIEKLGSRENILKAKLEMCQGMSEAGQLVLNGDDALLWNVRPQLTHRTYTYGIENEQADMRARNICQQEESCTFDLIYKQEIAHATIGTVGIHNVYNAMAAVLCGILCAIPFQSAAAALGSFKNASNRQNIYENRGIRIIDDCYNASPDSMKAALKVLREIEVRGHKIAVLADMLELGDYAPAAHLEVGRRAAESGVDILFAYGKDAQAYVDGAVEAGMDHDNAVLFNQKEALYRALAETAEQGDAVLFKGSRGMKLEEVIDGFLKEIGK